MIINELTKQFIDISPKIFAGFSVFIVSYFVALIAKSLVLRFTKHHGRRFEYVSQLFAKLIKATIIILGLVSALGTMGVNVSAMVAGLGLTGFALGFALKDALSNVLAGIMIMLYRPFKPKQKITVDKSTGTVKSIDLRYTTLENMDSIILIPNSKLLTNEVMIHQERSL